MAFLKKKILDAQNMDSSVASEAISTESLTGFSIQAFFTGTPNGTFNIQASDFPSSSSDIPEDKWTDLAGTEVSINSDGSALWNISDVHYLWARLKFTPGEGSSGSCSAYAVG